MTARIFLLVFALLITYVPLARAAVLHAIVLADTFSHTGDAAALELAHVTREIGRVSEYTGLTLKQQVFSGGSCRGQLLAALEELHPAEDDRVIVYFIGHGYRTSWKNGPWPLWYFSEAQNNLDMQLVVDTIVTKRPHFALILSDCCNNVMDGVVTFQCEPLVRGQRSLGAGYRKLFLESTGLVVVTASRSGDYAYCDDHGHCYSQAFWNCLRAEVRRSSPDWTRLLDCTARALKQIQIPYSETLTYY